jgi:Fic family protein
MTVMVELEQRVLAAQEKLSEALAELAKFSELRKGLESADESLTSAAKAIITLSEAAEKHTQNLSDASSALTAAVCSPSAPMAQI